MHPLTKRLRQIMRKHKLKAKDVAAITRRSVTTVNIWRCADDRRLIPAELLRLVELTAQAGAVKEQAEQAGHAAK